MTEERHCGIGHFMGYRYDANLPTVDGDGPNLHRLGDLAFAGRHALTFYRDDLFAADVAVIRQEEYEIGVLPAANRPISVVGRLVENAGPSDLAGV